MGSLMGCTASRADDPAFFRPYTGTGMKSNAECRTTEAKIAPTSQRHNRVPTTSASGTLLARAGSRGGKPEGNRSKESGLLVDENETWAPSLVSSHSGLCNQMSTGTFPATGSVEDPRRRSIDERSDGIQNCISHTSAVEHKQKPSCGAGVALCASGLISVLERIAQPQQRKLCGFDGQMSKMSSRTSNGRFHRQRSAGARSDVSVDTSLMSFGSGVDLQNRPRQLEKSMAKWELIRKRRSSDRR